MNFDNSTSTKQIIVISLLSLYTGYKLINSFNNKKLNKSNNKELNNKNDLIKKSKNLLKKQKNICVIGAGTIGLTTAIRTIKEFGDNVNITIIADKFLDETTSYLSGGLWEPYEIKETPIEKVNDWAQYSFNYFTTLYKSKNASIAGIKLIEAYYLYEDHEDSTPPNWKDIVFNFQFHNRKQLDKLKTNKKYVSGWSFGTYAIDQSYYMKYITSELKKNGVTFKQKKILSLIDLLKENDDNINYDIIINCTGLGSFELLDDKEMFPILGQVIRVKAPWITNNWNLGKYYIIPNRDCVILGGSVEVNNWNVNSSAEVTKDIMDKLIFFMPSLKDAEKISVHAGLRPGRSSIRLDSEMISRPLNNNSKIKVNNNNNNNNNNDILIVNNYGHGGAGITLSMGCANDVVVNHLKPFLRDSTISPLPSPLSSPMPSPMKSNKNQDNNLKDNKKQDNIEVSSTNKIEVAKAFIIKGDWIQNFSESGKEYWINQSNGHITWELPNE
jgi:glycine/D-amino acid oxidase-like deaminating enzyme